MLPIISIRGHNFLFVIIVETSSKPIYVRFLMPFRNALPTTRSSYQDGILKFMASAQIAADLPTTGSLISKLIKL